VATIRLTLYGSNKSWVCYSSRNFVAVYVCSANGFQFGSRRGNFR